MCNSIIRASRHGQLVMHLVSSVCSFGRAEFYESVIGSDSTQSFSTLASGKIQSAWEYDDKGHWLNSLGVGAAALSSLAPCALLRGQCCWLLLCVVCGCCVSAVYKALI